MPSKKRKTKPKPKDDLLRELNAIKRLLTLILLKIDTSQEELAKALQIDRADVSRMFPARQVKKLKFVRSSD